MQLTKRLRFKRSAVLSATVAAIAVLLTSCTSTGTATDGTGAQIGLASTGSPLADNLQTAAAQEIATKDGSKPNATGVNGAAQTAVTQNGQNGQTAAPTPGQTSPQTAAAGKNQKPGTPTAADAPQPQTASADATKAKAGQNADNAAVQPDTQLASAPQEPQQKSTLFGLFGRKNAATASEAPATATAVAAEQTEASAAKPGQTKAAEDQATTKAEEQKPVQVAALNVTSDANAFAPAQRPNRQQTSVSRLFSNNAGGDRGDGSEQPKLAVVRAVPAAKHDYNYSLPGVRPNGGLEIRHRKSMDDDSDIDANEDDDYASVQLASAPGLARLAPNGLRVQRETVDVACLKPELVKMLRGMESHFRRPVYVTSGYRSPSYNRKVNGARRSLHMICAAADIQITGVSKWEIAKYARSMPNRGGVGTYCHTSAVHVDVGPERDWNWKCHR